MNDTPSITIDKLDEFLQMDGVTSPIDYSSTMPSKPNITVTLVQKNNPVDMTIEKVKYDQKIHQLLDSIIELSGQWKIKDLDPIHLIVHDSDEFKALQKFRSVKELNNDLFTKNVIDKLIVHEETLFSKRNDNKAVRPTIVDIQPQIQVKTEITKEEEVVKPEKEKEKSKKKKFFRFNK